MDTIKIRSKPVFSIVQFLIFFMCYCNAWPDQLVPCYENNRCEVRAIHTLYVSSLLQTPSLPFVQPIPTTHVTHENRALYVVRARNIPLQARRLLSVDNYGNNEEIIYNDDVK